MMRRTPMKRGTKPMSRGTGLKAKGPMRRRYKPQSQRQGREYALACYGEPCYLRVPGVSCAKPDTVVPCHSNQQKHGKGTSHKADDRYTVPGCMHCHHEIDQGHRLTKDERRGIWDRAYQRWEPRRAVKMAIAEFGKNVIVQK